jgi:hypothetical protein
MEENQSKETKVESKIDKANNWFDKIIFKTMDFLGFTSGIGIVGIGGFWFIYSLLQYVFITPKNIMQQIVVENFFNQAQVGILIVAIGVLIMEVKKLQK